MEVAIKILQIRTTQTYHVFKYQSIFLKRIIVTSQILYWQSQEFKTNDVNRTCESETEICHIKINQVPDHDTTHHFALIDVHGAGSGYLAAHCQGVLRLFHVYVHILAICTHSIVAVETLLRRHNFCWN